MSTISQVGGASSDLYTYLQGLQQAQGGQGTQGTQKTHHHHKAKSSSSTSSTGSDAAQNPDGEGDGPHGARGPGGGGSKFGAIASAVTDALNNAPAGSDPNQVITDAIAKTLKSDSSATAGSNSTTASTTTTGTSSSTSTTPDSFKNLLDSLGITKEQFGQDFQAAIKESGVTFPTGSHTDVTA